MKLLIVQSIILVLLFSCSTTKVSRDMTPDLSGVKYNKVGLKIKLVSVFGGFLPGESLDDLEKDPHRASIPINRVKLREAVESALEKSGIFKVLRSDSTEKPDLFLNVLIANFNESSVPLISAEAKIDLNYIITDNTKDVFGTLLSTTSNVGVSEAFWGDDRKEIARAKAIRKNIKLFIDRVSESFAGR